MGAHLRAGGGRAVAYPTDLTDEAAVSALTKQVTEDHGPLDIVVSNAGKSLRLTRREADLLDFLLRHPRKPFTSKQLATLAWQNSRLSDAQVRTYIMRLRMRLQEVGLGHVITVVRNRGYGINASSGASSE